ncbi:MAG: DUF3887 domain-containing protein [Actinomycetota bacterium]|nr:DUF3887 domain-containing protein [Actinomycetota bacterium]
MEETVSAKPEDILTRQSEFINAGDYKSAYALFDQSTKQAISLDQYRAFFEAHAPYSMTNHSVLSTDVQGDRATVGVMFTLNSASGQEQLQGTLELVREEEQWRVVMPDEQASAFTRAEQETARYATESEPDPLAVPAPFDLTGVGASATEPFELESGLTIIKMSHQGSANFIVDLLDQAGTSVAPMGVANVIGPFEGSQAVQIPAAGQHLLNVQADGAWGFTIEQPRVSDAPATRSFSGNSKTATDLFALSGGLHRIQLTHQGDANFIVDLLDENGASVVPMGITNEIGPFDGSQAVTVPDDGVYLFQVEANGPWSIQVD